jgi:hypothetical protein
MTSQYPERVYSTEEDRGPSGGRMKPMRSAGRSRGMMLGGLVALGLGAWMLWHFGPDLRRYLKMERM